MIKRLAISGFMMVLASACTASDKSSGPIIHDGEYNFLAATHGEKWAKQDTEIEAKLAEIRKKNGGKRPNILYILIDDVSFGQMGNRTLNYVTGIQHAANQRVCGSEGLSLMRMYTEPSCTPTRAAMLTGRHPVRVRYQGGQGRPRRRGTGLGRR